MDNSSSSTACAEPLQRILIKSVGSAKPSSASAVATGLGLPAATVVSCLYRAPAILVDKISVSIANNLKGLLCDIGYDVEIQGTDDPTPEPAQLFDVAVYINNERKLTKVTESIASFIGMSEEDASKALLNPPYIMLGAVSQATVDALRNMIEGDALLVASEQGGACYDLFLSEGGSDVVIRRIHEDLANADITLSAESGLIASDIDPKRIEPIWNRYRASGLLRMINRDFLRFDITLQNLESPLNSEQKQRLQQLVGIPADIIDEVCDSTPVALFESVAYHELDSLMQAFSQDHLPVQADLITFQMLGIEIKRADNLPKMINVLHGLGVSGLNEHISLPFRLPNDYPELQARVIRSTLEDLGVDAALCVNRQ